MFLDYLSLVPDNFLLLGFFILFSFSIYNLNVVSLHLEHASTISSFFLLLLNFLLLIFSFQHFEGGFQDVVYLDDSTSFLRMLMVFLMTLFVFSYVSNDTFSVYRKVEMVTFCLLAILSLFLFVSTNNFISVYLLLEMSGFCFYLITAFDRKSLKGFEASLKYFILSSFASVLFIFGVSFIYGFTGTFSFEDLHLFFYNIFNCDSFIYLQEGFLLPLVCILLGLLFKLYVVPFHFWVGDVYQGSPYFGAFFFSFVSFFPFFLFLVKMYTLFFYFFFYNFYLSIYLLMALTMLTGSIGAMSSKDIRSVIAYSSVNAMGYFLTYFLNPDLITLKNVFFFIFVYVLSLFGVWIILGNFKEITSFRIIENYHSLGSIFKSKVLMTLTFALFFFSLGGIPPFLAFLAKIFLLQNLMKEQFYFVVCLVLVTTILSFYFYLRINKNIFYSNFSDWLFLCKEQYLSSFVSFLLLLVSFILIFFPNGFLTFFEHAVV